MVREGIDCVRVDRRIARASRLQLPVTRHVDIAPRFIGEIWVLEARRGFLNAGCEEKLPYAAVDKGIERGGKRKSSGFRGVGVQYLK